MSAATTQEQTERITKAGVGQKIHAKQINRKFIVEASCGAENGIWYCVTHDQAFSNNFEKDSHIRKGNHQFAWVCPVHGPEVP